MPDIVNLTGSRGDEIIRGIPLRAKAKGGQPERAATPEEAQAIKAAWPDLQMHVRRRVSDSEAVITLSSANLVNGLPELRIEPEYPLDDGTNGPALVITVPADKNQTALPQPDAVRKPDVPGAYFDVQFSGPEQGPYTFVAGGFTMAWDVTREEQGAGTP